MILKSLKLENIRSYKQAEVNFPLGKVLLSGDVGAGKSTILLAIDFVLFGLTKGIISGNTILRHGEREGYVELNFEIEGKPIIIKRTLKRSSEAIQQDAGYLIIEGKKVTGTATELKSKILEILNYPPEFLTKGKALIYRYTVYTPQEEMKEILLGEEEIKLNTLRRVFGIDKYKRVVENSQILVREYNFKRKELNAYAQDINLLKNEIKSKNDEMNFIFGELKNLGPVEVEVNLKFDNLRKDYDKYNNELKFAQDFKGKIALFESEINNKNEILLKNQRNFEKLNYEISELSKENLVREDDFVLKQEISKQEKEIENREKELKLTEFRMYEIEAEKKSAEKIKNSIMNLNQCPTCKQDVSKEYKSGVFERQNIIIQETTLEINKIKLDLIKNNLELNNLRTALKLLNERLNKTNLVNFKIKALSEKNETIKKIESENIKLKEDILDLNSSKIKFVSDLELIKDSEKKYLEIKKEIDFIIDRQRAIAIKKTSLTEKINSIQEFIQRQEKEIARKEKSLQESERLSSLVSWLNGKFTEMVLVMEKNIMKKIHSDFSIIFGKWFNTLIDDDLIQIYLDENFNLKITQNGYDSEYLNLSGGEKTACALAYRLALNQVINKMMSHIRTRDLIILDEPTDGFSSEQLDRMKLVLDELEIKQVIIVSHESKIESFVDKLIKIEKKQHISKMIN
ncbi:hypothetical protein J4403_02860 [Candidatus Woesearchaeota archaeon]|nr:hypothetical protein [Candidatus Woesearchaeota archaeon]